MQRFLKLTFFAALACAVLPVAAFAHAFLDRAVPGVGTTVTGSPSELKLMYTEDVVVAFSGVSLRGAGGAIPVSRPTAGPANTLHVHIGRPLKPGTYTVSWHVVSVDTHHTQGTYKFTIAP